MGEEWQERTVFVILFQLISEFAFFGWFMIHSSWFFCFGKKISTAQRRMENHGEIFLVRFVFELICTSS